MGNDTGYGVECFLSLFSDPDFKEQIKQYIYNGGWNGAIVVKDGIVYTLLPHDKIQIRTIPDYIKKLSSDIVAENSEDYLVESSLYYVTDEVICSTEFDKKDLLNELARCLLAYKKSKKAI